MNYYTARCEQYHTVVSKEDVEAMRYVPSDHPSLNMEKSNFFRYLMNLFFGLFSLISGVNKD